MIQSAVFYVYNRTNDGWTHWSEDYNNNFYDKLLHMFDKKKKSETTEDDDEPDEPPLDDILATEELIAAF